MRRACGLSPGRLASRSAARAPPTLGNHVLVQQDDAARPHGAWSAQPSPRCCWSPPPQSRFRTSRSGPGSPTTRWARSRAVEVISFSGDDIPASVTEDITDPRPPEHDHHLDHRQRAAVRGTRACGPPVATRWRRGRTTSRPTRPSNRSRSRTPRRSGTRSPPPRSPPCATWAIRTSPTSARSRRIRPVPVCSNRRTRSSTSTAPRSPTSRHCRPRSPTAHPVRWSR